MSIYSSADLIKNMLRYNDSYRDFINTRNHSFIDKLFSSDSTPVFILSAEQRALLQTILASLKELGKQAKPAEQKAELLRILEDCRKLKQSTLSKDATDTVNKVIADLAIVANVRTITDQPPRPPLTAQQRLIIDRHKLLLESKFLLKPLQQGAMNELGNSEGECHGFTKSMADSDLSPYKNNAIDHIRLNKNIHKYQKNQLNREKDQRSIKSTRLTGHRFCPSIKEQAKALYDIASKNEGIDLAVSLGRRHSTYLSKQADGKIRYADSNHGVFLFDTKEQFIAAYRLIYQLQHSLALTNNAYLSYEVSKMIEDKSDSLEENKTWSGLLRSLLTGTKYRENTLSNLLDPGLLLISCTIVGTAVGSFVPVIGTLIGFGVGAAVGALASASSILISLSRYSGLLSPYHIIRDKLHHGAEFIKKKLGMSHECDELIEVPDVQAVSTSHLKMTGMGLTPEEPTIDHTTVSTAEPINNDTDQILNLLSESEHPEQPDSSPNDAIGLK